MKKPTEDVGKTNDRWEREGGVTERQWLLRMEGAGLPGSAGKAGNYWPGESFLSAKL